MSRILDVYLHAIYAGKLLQNNSGSLSFTYDKDYVNKNLPQLSVSLPLSLDQYIGDKVKAFFAGLLPDDFLRHKLARYLGVSEKNAFALLEIIGGECAGAVSVYPQGQDIPKTKSKDVEILDDYKLKEIINLLKNRPFLVGNKDLRLSLAGAQDKIAVGLKDNKIALIKGTSPTTHILKPTIDDITDSVHNEFFCMRLAGMVGINVPFVYMRYIGSMPYFLIQRYDRMQDNSGHIKRVHQEDFCQALGILPEIKYEREGGPSFNQCQEIIKINTKRPAADQITLLNLIIYNYFIGNMDAHGKNFSLLYKDKRPELAPAYDLLSTAIYPELSNKMAMKIGSKYKPEHVFVRHWYSLVPDTKVAKKNLEKNLLSLSYNCIEKAYCLKDDLKREGVTSIIFKKICSYIEKQAKHIRNELQ